LQLIIDFCMFLTVLNFLSLKLLDIFSNT